MPTQPPLWEKPLWFQWLLLVTLVFCSYSVIGMAAQAIPRNNLHALAVLTSLGFILLPALVYAFMVYRNPLVEAGFTNPSSLWYYVIAVCIMPASIPLVQALAVWNMNLHLPAFMKGLDTWIHTTEKAQNGNIEGQLNMATPAGIILNLIVMALFPALGEEALFRGGFQKLIFRRTHSVHKAVFWAAVIFSAVHFQFLTFLPRLLLGMVLGYLYAYSGSLWPAIIAHFIYNASQVLQAYLQQHQSADHPSPIFQEDYSMPVVYTLISTALVFAGIYWMRKLNPKKWP